MKYFRSIIAAIVAVAASMTIAHAQEDAASPVGLTIAGGGGAKQGSVYSSVLATLSQRCSTDNMKLTEVNTSGGVENLTLLRTRKVRAAIVPNDLLYAAKLENPASVSNLKVVIPLHNEDVHLFARDDVKTEGGFNVLGKQIGGTSIEFNRPEDLKGRVVGAVGGSAVTARVLSELLDIGFTVKNYESNLALAKALTAKEIDAGLVVAGSPSPVVDSLRGFKLLPLRGNTNTNAVYTATKIQYAHMGNNRAADTLSTQALLVAGPFRGQEAIGQLASLRSCFLKNLDAIADADGSHPVWSTMDPTVAPKWEMYNLPNAAVMTVPAAQVQQPKKK